MNIISPLRALVEEPPSITQQADVHIVDFKAGKPDGVEYFNSSIFAMPSRDWLVVRRSKFNPEAWVGTNDLMAFSLTDYEPQVGYGLRSLKHNDDEQFEDGRAICHDGRVYISNCNFRWFAHKSAWTGAHQNLQVFDANTWSPIARHDIVFGNNLDRCSGTKGAEKNWLPFFHDGLLHFVYRGNPHVVFKCNPKMEAVDKYESDWDASHWTWGEIRGGTPPVRVGDTYWTMFHSSLPWKGGKRRYYAGWLAFEAKPPFKVIACSESPALVGSTHDGCPKGKLPCTFPAGLIHRENKFIVSFGVNDMKTAIGFFPMSEIEKGMVRI